MVLVLVPPIARVAMQAMQPAFKYARLRLEASLSRALPANQGHLLFRIRGTGDFVSYFIANCKRAGFLVVCRTELTYPHESSLSLSSPSAFFNATRKLNEVRGL